MKLEELARLAGVSKATASIILNGRAEQYRISKLTQERVTALAEKYHYIANVQAAGLRSHTSQLVALIVPELTHGGFACFARTLELRLRAQDYHLLVSCSEDEPEVEACALRALIGHQVDAIVTISCHSSDQMYQSLTDNRIPIILIDRKIPDSRYPSIISNDLDTSLQLTSLLLESSHQQPVYLGGIAGMRNSLNRLQGYREILDNAGININEDYIFHHSYTAEAGYEMIRGYFSQHHVLPKNLLTASFTLMEGALSFVREHYALLPENLNWATFGDNMMLDLLPFPIHSARLDYTSMAEHTVNLLLSGLAGDSEQQAIVLSRDIIRR
ncbi:LacI family DNA-binding transcriptional regulator [Endozoicomonas euniceicola]|uniref:LacI family DNA-binding transcriptional regulator n=1 Tax=Endozoicomonas euniceicola TaxID=1234143 RepID=A0ABY6GZB8_9GAMM|nr:LacI family DNA-binding transcriptional regulator [Endozoicomonas euniceicola]UYM17338.1 LacI family DNA-binding transcriptional regulator [Endozoicomonas euniceicola]